MKYILQILSIGTVIVLMISFQPATAQSDIDTNRMNRDINIMENVLEELFKTRWSAHGNHVRVNSGSFSFGYHSTDITGTYLPDYGIIFTIPAQTPGLVMVNKEDDKEFSFNFEYGDDADGKKVTEESVTNKIVEFLRDYGSTIGQLADKQNVTLIYKTETPDRRITFFSSGEDKADTNHVLPTISVSAKVEDLKAHRSGNINDSDFRNRLDISTNDNSSKPEKDLRVMANIIKTAFEDTEKKSFQVRGSVDAIKLNNFGAIFSFDAQYADHSPFDLSGLHESLKVIKEELQDAKIELEREIRTTVDSTRSERRKKIEASRKEQKQKAKEAYDQFLNDLKSTIADYGRTLRSVQSDQQILFSIALNSPFDDIPERVDLQVQKSALEQGNREQVISEINVREY